MRSSTPLLLLALTGLCCLAAPAHAQRAMRPDAAAQPQAQERNSPLKPAQVVQVDKALFSITYDDGEAENGYGAASDFYDAAMRFNLPKASLRVDEVTVCFSRLGADDELGFDITFWAADGPGGIPGTLLDAVPAIATDVPTDLTGAYYTYDLADLNIMLNSTTVYIGVGWEPVDNEDFFVCSDWDRPTVQPGYDMLNLDDDWVELTSFDPDYTALMVRGVFNDELGTGTDCVEDATTLCLQGNRFEVKVDWTRPNGTTGQGMAEELTPDTGYFWFFRDTNVEMVIKVLDNCGGNTNRFWVFAGGLTNVEVDITVTDTETGAVRTYHNPQSTAFQPIQDTRAFDTCP